LCSHPERLRLPRRKHYRSTLPCRSHSPGARVCRPPLNPDMI
jgi:hypothetical protein